MSGPEASPKASPEVSPEVSVVIPVFDRQHLVADAIASVQRQDVDAEILVADDGSTDASTEVVAALAADDRRIVLLQGPHRGPAAARNRAIAVATGEYLTFVDSDDLCPPGRIRRQIDKLRGRPDVVAVVGAILGFDAVDAGGRPVPSPAFTPHHNAALHTATFRTAAFRGFGALDESLRHAEDVDFFLRLLEADARLILEAAVASHYRSHEGNMVGDVANTQRGYLGAYARSIARRRAAGRTRPLDSFFLRHIQTDVEFGGGDPARDNPR